jgi:predicted Zn-dependent protease
MMPLSVRGLIGSVLMVLSIGIVVSCTSVPITKRSSFQIVPDSELSSMSLTEYRKVLSKSKLSGNTADVARVRRVGNRIAASAEQFLREEGLAADIQHFKWEFNLIEDDETANAWVMPGGKAAVYTGILKYTQDDTGLAVVLGHEVAHAIAGHGNERMSQGMMAQMGAVALSVALASQPAVTQDLFMQAYGVGTNVGVLLPYSRLHESEADRIGLVIMARAGYDPEAAVPFWKRMNASGGARPPELLSTHPAPSSRIANIKKHLPEAMRHYRPGSAN